MSSLLRLLNRYDGAKFGVAISAFAETGGSLNIIVTDEGRTGVVRGHIEKNSKYTIQTKHLPSGLIKLLENHVIQSGIFQLEENEPDYPLIKDGIEWFLLDGVHYKIEVFFNEKQKSINRFNWREPTFAKLFNSILNHALDDDMPKNEAMSFYCYEQMWEIIK